MARYYRAAATAAALLIVVSFACAQASVRVSVSPEKNDQGAYTGRYVAKIEVTGAPTAREVVVNVRFPAAYGIDTAADDIRIKDVRAGEDVYSVTVEQAQTPVCFVEASKANDKTSIWIVALLNDNQNDPKHVCDVVFTSRGRATREMLGYGEVEVKDGNLQVLADTGTYGSARVPLFGDLDWDGTVDFDDVLMLAAAWEAANGAQPRVLEFADLAPYQGGDTLKDRVSSGDQKIDFNDVLALAWAWEQYHQ